MQIGTRIVRLITFCVALVAACHWCQAEEARLGYRRDVLPILSDRCLKCHGPDSAARKAGLRLDRPDDATAKLESGEMAIVPGDLVKSALVTRISSSEADEMMPPPDSGKTLSTAEKAVLKRWVAEGAKYEKHWAFVVPVRPQVPQVKRSDLVANAIDNFVIAKLEAEGLEPAPRATKERLIRRLYFDFVGVPPSLPEIDAFLADKSPDAYEKVVDHLLKSPHYGECMAADWLDGARFADSNGYQNDFARNMSPWRDWVIKAYNDHMRYDQFVTEQLAGDLLLNSSLSTKIATGFNRNHRTVTEAGSIEEEWFVENVVDRVETFGTVMLGLTVGCGRCHDHKFDPFSRKDFYQLFAFFGNVNEKGVYTETRGNVPPMVKALTAENEKRLAEFDTQFAAAKKQVDDHMRGIGPARQDWLKTLSSTPATDEPVAAVSIPLESNAIALATATNGAVDAAPTSVAPGWKDDVFGKTPSFAGKQHLDYSGIHFPIADRSFSWAAWVKPTGDGAVFSKMDNDQSFRGCDLLIVKDGKIEMHIVAESPDNQIKVVSKNPLPQGEWSHVVETYDGSGKAAGISLYVNGEKQELTVEVDKLTGSFDNDQPFRIGMRSTDSQFHGAIRDVQLYQHALSAFDVKNALRGALRRGLQNVKPESLTDSPRDQFDKLLLPQAKDPFAVRLLELRRGLEAIQADKTKYDAAIPMAMILEDLQQPRATYMLKRGRYDMPDKSQPVQPDVPEVMPRLPAGAPHNRLGLAKWLVSPDNPLAARVVVNRLWQHHFGIGLVKSSDNFGVQSEPPSHPELLDWLATELIQSGWDLQHIERLIVQSHTYQQRSEASPELYQRDPDNRLLARGPRYRLPAEALRDNALAVSGLLTPKIGGNSVMPYQPAGLWEELAGGAHEDYIQGHGDDLYRRSLYTYRKRTVPHPSMATFDAPSWEVCQVKRAKTNTPLQALALLNDVTYMEAARKLAERMLTEGGSTADARLAFAFRLTTSRVPTPRELELMRTSLEKYRIRFHTSPAEAEKYLGQGESPRNKSIDAVDLAAHTAVASVLINMDEAISKN